MQHLHFHHKLFYSALQEVSQTVNNSHGLLFVVTFGLIFKADGYIKNLMHKNVYAPAAVLSIFNKVYYESVSWRILKAIQLLLGINC